MKLRSILLGLLLATSCLAQPARSSRESKTAALVFQHVSLIDMTGAAPQREMTVIVTADRIAAIGATGQVKIPKGARVIDATGKFMIPGLWDMHVHLAKTGENTLPLFLANGVTGVRDMGGDPALVLRWRAEIAAGQRLGPRIKAAGPILESASNVARMLREGGVEPYARFRVAVGSPAEAEPAVARLAALGVDFLKLRTVTSLETYQAIAAAAHKHKLPLVGHSTAAPEEILKAGQRSVEHSFFPPLNGRTAEQRAELFKQMAQAGVALTPTLIVGEALLTTYDRAAALAEDAAGKLDARRKYLSGYLIEDWREQVAEKKDTSTQMMTKLLDDRLRDVREMHQAGVRMLAGTDAAVLLIWPGFSLHDELRLLVEQAGLTPLEALVSATRAPAEFFGMQETLGTIAAGKLADLVLLDADPLVDIRNSQKISGVVASGRYLNQTELARLLARAEKAARPSVRPAK
jgi:imidazolonepropionase-like amidohydrolase